MKQLLTINIKENSKKSFTHERMETNLRAQIENSIALGWDKEDILILSNIDFDVCGIKSVNMELNDHCLTGSKLFGVAYVMNTDLVHWLQDDILWAHDLDLWESEQLQLPKIKDMALSTYSGPNKYNGGSIFWTVKAKDILDEILIEIKDGKNKEEPTINKVLKSGKYDGRYTVLDYAYNIGCSGFVPRIVKAKKPIKCVHFNPFNNISWETHALDRDGTGMRSISDRLEEHLRKYFILATELSDKGKKRQEELRIYHEKQMGRYLGKKIEKKKKKKKKDELKSKLCLDCTYYKYYKDKCCN